MSPLHPALRFDAPTTIETDVPFKTMAVHLPTKKAPRALHFRKRACA